MGDLRQMATNAVAYNHPDYNPGGMESAMGTAEQLVRVAEHALLTASVDVKAAERAIRQEASMLVVWGGVGWPWAECALLRQQSSGPAGHSEAYRPAPCTLPPSLRSDCRPWMNVDKP